MKTKRCAMSQWRSADNETNKIGHGWGSTDFYNRIVLKDWHEEPLPIHAPIRDPTDEEIEMRVLDRTGNYYCPNCGGQHAFHYEEIPEHQRLYVQGDEQTVEHMPEIRDYECSDCGFTWSLNPAQEQ